MGKYTATPTYEELVEALATVTEALRKRGVRAKGDGTLLTWAERIVLNGRVAVEAVRCNTEFRPSRLMISRSFTMESTDV